MSTSISRRGLLAAAALALAGCQKRQTWALDDVSRVLPDLKFDLVDDQGHPVTAKSYAGKVVVLYFGYTHCPDVCPLTMAHLSDALQRLGAKASDVRILFVSVDPNRDSRSILQAYTRAFSPQAVGLTGTMDQIQDVAKRYHVAFNYGARDKDGNYPVDHSAAIYIFDREGHGRLIGSDVSPADKIAHDLAQLIDD